MAPPLYEKTTCVPLPGSPIAPPVLFTQFVFPLLASLQTLSTPPFQYAIAEAAAGLDTVSTRLEPETPTDNDKLEN